ncbi:MAG: rRNA pseudouridine synthase [Clostridium sp.]|nr:rRNA pseudouridine synthase [Clostridium sp.]
MERIQKVISNLGYASRREAEKLILDGKVKVNGEIIRELGTKVTKKDVITVCGDVLDKNKNYEYYILNKPRGVISSVSDPCGRRTVVDLIETDARIYPIGRLDYDTTGVLLLTNDGELANKLMHPSSNIEKTYVVKVDGLVTGKDIKTLRNGVIINGNKTYPAKVKLKSYNKKTDKSIVVLTIHEGKNHQVKNMFKVLGYDVLKLKREKYADLGLVGLRVGEYRKLTNKEVSVLYSKIKTTK